MNSVAISPDGDMLAVGGCGSAPIQLWDLARPNKSRNPFGVADVPDPNGKDVQRFADLFVELSGGAKDDNAKLWTDKVVKGDPKSLEGEWASRWKSPGISNGKWFTGTAKVKCVGDRVYILYTEGERPGSYLIDALRVDRDRLVARYISLDFGTPGMWVGKIIDHERIDGQWSGGGKDLRWDLRRKVADK
jgi:hypothetical protein